jgi:hypothetical protein
MEAVSVATPMARAWARGSPDSAGGNGGRPSTPQALDVDECLSRFSRHVEDVETLTAKVVANKHSWRATDSEWTFLLLLAYLNEVELPSAVVDSTDAALVFLVGAKFGLETTQRILRGLPRSPR